MNFLKTWNRAFFKQHFSGFEIMCFIIIGQLAADYSRWWFLALIPAVLVSAAMQQKLGVADD